MINNEPWTEDNIIKALEADGLKCVEYENCYFIETPPKQDGWISSLKVYKKELQIWYSGYNFRIEKTPIIWEKLGSGCV